MPLGRENRRDIPHAVCFVEQGADGRGVLVGEEAQVRVALCAVGEGVVEQATVHLVSNRHQRLDGVTLDAALRDLPVVLVLSWPTFRVAAEQRGAP